MLRRMFSSQLFGMTDDLPPQEVNAQEPSTMLDVDDYEISRALTSRYPKRKRAAVTYMDEGSDVESSDDEEDFYPQRKV
jgi:hypothetical protein